MITKNYNEITKNICIIPDSYYSKLSNVYTNLENLFATDKNIPHYAEYVEMKSDMCDNGQMETIKSVRIGFKMNSKGVITAFYIIYQLFESNSTIVVGPGFVDEKHFTDGICTTIHKTQGQETKIIVPIFTEYINMSYDVLLVAISRATEKVIILKKASKNGMKDLQNIVSRDRPMRQSSLSDMLLTTFKKK